MEYPSDKQLAEAIVEGKRAGESHEQIEHRVEDLCRWSDEDLAAVGIVASTRREPR